MDKDKILAALNAIQNGEGADGYHDELETTITLLLNASDEDVAAAWEDFSIDTK